MNKISAEEGGWPIIAVYKYGAFLYVPEDDIEPHFPHDLWQLLNYAKYNDCLIVRLDADGDIVADGLPRYDW